MVITIKFTNIISDIEVAFLRGAVLKAVGNDASILFHNHDGEKLRYAYPLIQYKRIDKKAAIVCIGEGTEAIAKLFEHNIFNFQLGKRAIVMNVEDIITDYTKIQICDSSIYYKIRNWMPLNSENFHKFQNTESAIERISFLERMLIGNLLSMCKGIGIRIQDRIECHLLKIGDPYKTTNKSTQYATFDAEFKCNMLIPNFLGIGKHTSQGGGVIERIENK